MSVGLSFVTELLQFSNKWHFIFEFSTIDIIAFYLGVLQSCNCIAYMR